MSEPQRAAEAVEIDTLVGNYIAAWGEPDPAARNALLEAVWNAQGTYTDPLSHAANRAELATLIGKFMKRNPGAKFTIKGKADRHHGHLRFFWAVNLADGSELSGMDYGEVGGDGKLSKIVGFF